MGLLPLLGWNPLNIALVVIIVLMILITLIGDMLRKRADSSWQAKESDAGQSNSEAARIQELQRATNSSTQTELKVAPMQDKDKQLAEEQSGVADSLKKKIDQYANIEEVQRKVLVWSEQVRRLMTDPKVRDRVLSPIAALFEKKPGSKEENIRHVITQVAVINAVIAGLPGKLGVGVYISIAMEMWMAMKIGQYVGISITKPQDTLKHLGLLTGIVLAILVFFKEILGLFFSVFATVGWLPATFLAELAATSFVGVCFWLGFEEVAKGKPFGVPLDSAAFIPREMKDLVGYQYEIIRQNLNRERLSKLYENLKAYFTGEIAVSKMKGEVRDDRFVALAMVALVEDEYDKLEGPAGQLFLQSIRDVNPQLSDATIPEIAEHMRGYSDEQMVGVMSSVKGRLFERMVEAAENTDADSVIARLHDDMYNPSTDIVFTNTDTGERFAVSLKATDDVRHIEEALARYPSDRIIATKEVAGEASDIGMVEASDISNEELSEITEENFDELLDGVEMSRWDASGVVGIGSVLAVVAAVWPFVIAYFRKRISEEQLKRACVRLVGSSGTRIATRIAGAVVLGPIFLWYLLAKVVFDLVESGRIQPPAESVQ